MALDQILHYQDYGVYMQTTARNLPEGSGTPAPPPPPQEVSWNSLTALWLDQSAARRAEEDAKELWAALKADPATTPDEWFRIWDRAALCKMARRHAQQAFQNAVAVRIRVAA